ncbi:PD-(D/E)XK nuclease family protein [Salibacterium aidingense]|uniref:PD-(D/E)XK nuclease family protein n=1 Tax=Salibacterium aidingense TaxID=384933 RepID=UPI003BE87C04
MNSSISPAEAKKQLDRIADIYPYIKEEDVQSNDTVLTILNKQFHDENAISDYLAYVLNPNVNGVGIQPLHNLLQLITPSVEVTDADNVQIEREYPFPPSNRRIDFLITINDETAIAIEHKVFAPEHKNQTSHYETDMQKAFGAKGYRVEYMFLTPDGKKCGKLQGLAPISYHHLVTALKNAPIRKKKRSHLPAHGRCGKN